MSVHPLSIRPETIWIEGQEWVPASYAAQLVDLVREKQRTDASHKQQFAEIRNLWANLPHTQAGAPYAKSPEAFRKHGLIAKGFCDVETVDCETHSAALAAAPLIADLARKAHGYALTVVRGPLVVCSTPLSQSYKEMGKDVFQASKQAVLDWGHEVLGITA